MASWSTVTVTGYNTSPPPDDGSQIASNKVTWAGIKTKIGDPLNTAISALNSSGAGVGAIVDSLNAIGTLRSLLLNGGMEVWQRGAGGAAVIAVAATSQVYGPDRWFLTTLGSAACTLTQSAGLTTQSQWACKVQRNNGQTGTNVLPFEQPFPLDQVVAMRGKNLFVSFSAKAGANYSPTNGQLGCQAWYGTGAAGKRGLTPYTGETASAQILSNLSTSATAFSGNLGAVPTNATQMCLQFYCTPSGTAGADDSYTIDDIQLEFSSTAASTFERRPFLFELSQVTPFYCKTFPYTVAPAQSGGVTGALTVFSGTGVTNTEGLTWAYPTRMRTTPSITTFNPSAGNANWRDVTSSADRAVTVGTVSDASVPISMAAAVAATTNQIHAQADAEL